LSTEIEYVKLESSSKKKSDIPVTTTWKDGTKMIRNHSIKVTVKEILRLSNSLDVVKINIIGGPGTGKTTLATTLGHLIHQMSDIPYAIKVLNRDNLLSFEETLKTLSPTNYVLIFDDVSFLGASANKKQIEVVKKAFTEIRHLEGGQDVKIIAIFNFHYNFGFDKYLRQSEFSYWTTIGSSEMENMQKIVGMKNSMKLEKFQRISLTALHKDKFSFLLGKRAKKENWFTYSFRQPFAPALFWNNVSLRTVVFPKREWIDKLCSICIQSKPNLLKDGIDVKDFAEDITKKFGVGTARSAIRVKLFQNGINVFPKRFKQCLKYIDEYMENKVVNLQEIADYYNFKDDRTRLDEKIPK